MWLVLWWESTLLQNFWTTLAFSFSLPDFRLKYPSKSSLQLYPLVCSGLLTSDVSIKSGDIALREEWNRCLWHVSKSPLKQRSLMTTSQLFFKALAINVAWNCNVFFPQWNKCLKISNRESRHRHIIQWWLTGFMTYCCFHVSQNLSTEGIFYDLQRFIP